MTPTEHRLIQAVIKERKRSDLKHGTWDKETFKQMEDYLKEEVFELMGAIFRGDYKGKHGVYNEAIQVANTALKMAEQVVNRFGEVQ